MRLPVLEAQDFTKENTEAFSGYCHKLKCVSGEWYDEKNMSTDYFPAASPRCRRSVQLGSASNSVTENASTNNSATHTASGALGAEYLDGDLYMLKRVKNLSEQSLGACYIKNGANATFSGSISGKLGYFGNSSVLRKLVRMGSYLCAFPDGVVYESANTSEALPLFKISAEKQLTDFLISTVYKNSSDDYINVLDYTGSFRVEDGGVNEYLSDKGMWVGRQTWLKISALSSANAFKDFSVNDSVEITATGSPNNTAISGSLIFKRDANYINTASFKILEIGSEYVNGYNRDYIIIPGYINDEVRSKAYVNASSFEIRNDLFPTANFEEGMKIKLHRKCPNIAHACESQNRLWGCSADGREIYASALGNPYNFYDFSGISTDSYAVNVGTQGEFTACINYLGRPFFFKENSLHVISGSYPTNSGELDGMSYSVSTVTEFKGVEKGSERSLAVIDNILYYKSYAGIVAFDGANTAVISDDLGSEKYKNAVAGAYNNKYYVSMQNEAGEYSLFVYDTELSAWSREDNTHALQFIKVGSELLYLDADDGKLYSVNSTDALGTSDYEKEGAFEWECETGNYGYSYPNSKYLSRLQLRLKLAENAEAAVFIQYNSDGVWHRKGEISGNGIKTHLLPIVPVRCDHMKLKLKGRGDVKILSIARILEVGGDV